MDIAIKGSKAKLKVSDATFGRPFSEALVHQVVTAYLAGARAGTKAQKSRSTASGGGAKPWRQKGTGRARAGTIRSPIWRGGGRTFAAQPRNFEQKVNKKMYRGAMQAILSELLRQERLIVVKKFSVAEPKTKVFLAKAKKLGLESGLIVTAEVDANLALSCRNVPKVYAMDVRSIDPASLVAADKVIITADAVALLQEWLG